MNKKRLKKEPGLRWVENQGSVHYFSFGYASNPDIKIIHGMIEWFNIKSKGKREIVIRDIRRFNHIQNGACSCGDYW
uniref:DYW domain-containing protein n=1 Tax=Solanum lycopersicum TaxID=4081 RepID=K4BZM6_SOLLC